MNKNFWKNRRVLITGHEGFVGSSLMKKLVQVEACLLGVDIAAPHKNSVLTSYRDYFESLKLDIRDRGLLSKTIMKFNPEFIFHLAARAIVGEANEDPINTFETNIEATWNILEVGRRLRSLKCLVIASSDKAYGSHKKLPYVEGTPLRGEHPYDVSKSCADLIAQSYHKSFGLPVVITRCGNIYGPGDLNFSRLIPDAIRCLLTSKVLDIRSNGKFTRDYIYIDDVVNGYLKVAAHYSYKGVLGQAFNLSNEHPHSVLSIIRMLNRRNFSVKPLRFRILNQAAHEISHQYLSAAKARHLLNWTSTVSVEEGLERTIEWYRQLYC